VENIIGIFWNYILTLWNIIIGYIIPGVLLLAPLIIVHELGHLILAKLSGVRVLKFSVGFGPKIFSKKIGETEYALSWIPFGGYVKPLGEAPDEEVPEEDKPFSLNHQTLPKRFSVLAAGSVFNILFAVLLFAVLYMSGIEILTPVIGKVHDDTPALKAGIIEGDIIIAVNGSNITLWDELVASVEGSEGKELILHIKRGDETIVTSLKPKPVLDSDILRGTYQTYRIGISPSEDAFVTKRYNPASALWMGLSKTVEAVKVTYLGMAMMIRSPVENKEHLGGPIRIVEIAGDFASVGIKSFLFLMAMISVNLGVLNLLPIPVLDGGHIFFLCVEAMKGSPLSWKKMEVAQMVGLALLLSLMVFVSYNDIMRYVPN